MKRFALFLFISQIYIFFSNYPIIVRSRHMPINSVYNLVDTDRFSDYNGYLATITQGQHGFLFFHNPYTTEKAVPNLFYFPYLAAGWITGIFDISPFIVYHVMKILFAEFYCLALYILCIELFGKKQAYITGVLALTATVPPLFFFDFFGISSVHSWWRLQDAFLRLSDAPHHLLGETLLVTSVIFYMQAVYKDKIKLFIISGISSFLCGIIFPPSLLPFMTICITIQFSIFFLKKQRKPAYFLVPFILGFLSILLGFLQMNLSYFRDIWNTWEITQWNIKEINFDQIFLISLNIFPFFILIYFLQIIKNSQVFSTLKNNRRLPILVWSLAPFILIPFATTLGISKIRLYGMLPYLPLSWIFYLVISKSNKIVALFLLSSVILFNFSTSLSLLKEESGKIARDLPYSNVYYPLKNWTAISFLENTTKEKTVILSNEQIGNIIPAYIPVISYFGHVNLTVDFRQKQYTVWRFYTNNMTNAEAEKFISDNGINFIWWGEDEKSLGSKSLSYSFIYPVYNMNDIIIYRIKNT